MTRPDSSPCWIPHPGSVHHESLTALVAVAVRCSGPRVTMVLVRRDDQFRRVTQVVAIGRWAANRKRIGIRWNQPDHLRLTSLDRVARPGHTRPRRTQPVPNRRRSDQDPTS
jgi:hypothetical protein